MLVLLLVVLLLLIVMLISRIASFYSSMIGAFVLDAEGAMSATSGSTTSAGTSFTWSTRISFEAIRIGRCVGVLRLCSSSSMEGMRIMSNLFTRMLLLMWMLRMLRMSGRRNARSSSSPSEWIGCRIF